MKPILFNPNKGHSYKNKIFSIPGSGIPFDTEFELVGEKSSRLFMFSHSTGSEWDPKTKWIYKTDDSEFELHLGNEDVTPQHQRDYLMAKMR